MKYAVFSPNNKLICFDNDDEVKAYCMQKQNDYLDKYMKDQELEYENMTPVEIGYAYTTVGAERGGCKIYYTRDVLNTMKEYEVERELICAVNEMFNNRRTESEIDCPSYLEDVFSQMTPMDVAEMVSCPYTLTNVDGINDDGMPYGI